MDNKSLSSLKSFGQIAKEWEEISLKKYAHLLEEDGDEVEILTKEKIAFWLVCEAARGDFDFLLPFDDEKDKKYETCLFKDMLGKTTCKSEDIKKELQSCVGEELDLRYNMSCHTKYFKDDNKSSLTIASQIAEKIYICKGNFLRWCRVGNVDGFFYSLQEYDKDSKQYYCCLPKFWGDYWRVIPDYFDLAKNNLEYPLSEVCKFLLDPEFWDDYIKWSTKKSDRNSQHISADIYNMYVDVEQRLEGYLKAGKLSLQGYENKFSVSNKPSIIRSNLISRMKINYRNSSATLGDNKIKYLSIILKPVASSKSAGAHKKNLAQENNIIEELKKNHNDLLLGIKNRNSIAREIYEKIKNEKNSYSFSSVRKTVGDWCTANNILASDAKKPKHLRK